LSRIWTPPDRDDWGVVQDVEPSERSRQLPDGRVQQESRLTLSPAAIEEMWQGYRCAACLERQDEAYPEHCRATWCRFPIRAEQRRQLEQDFIGQQPGAVSGFPLERELAYLEERHHVKKPLMTVPKEIK
jgi:hypothetical protein